MDLRVFTIPQKAPLGALAGPILGINQAQSTINPFDNPSSPSSTNVKLGNRLADTHSQNILLQVNKAPNNRPRDWDGPSATSRLQKSKVILYRI